MPLINIVFILIVVGVALWAINTFIPLPRLLKAILNIVVVVFVCLWLLQTFGVIDSFRGMRLQ